MLSDGEGSLAPSSRTSKVVHRPPFWELRKKIKALQKAISSNPNVFANTKNVPIGANPRLKAGTLSVEEIICALAETRGSVGEVITRLSDHNLEFISEIQLVCSALNVKSMVCALPGGTDLFNIELETVAHQTSSPLKSLSPAKSSKRPASENRISFILKREKSLMAAASDPENATAPTLSSFSHSQPLPSTRTSHSTAMQDDVSVLSDDARSLGSMGSLGSQRRVATTGGISFDLGRQQSSSGSIKSQGSQPSQNSANMLKPTLLSRPESLPSLRDQPGEHTHLVYPHLQISQVSPTVKKRASIVTFKPLVPLIRASTSSSIEGIGGAGVAPSLKPTFSQPDVIYREGRDGSLSPLSIGGASFSSFSPDARRMSPTQKDRDSRSNTASDLVRSTPLSAAASDAKIDTTLSRSGDGLMTPNSFTSLSVSGGNHHSLAMNALKKSFRVQQNIVDELYEEQKLLSPSLAVMSRRDAILAKQEETLLKSEKVYIREKIERKHRLRDR